MSHGMVGSIVEVAIVGLGRISRLHVNAAISQWKDCRVKAVCDVDEERVRDVKAHIEQQYSALLDQPNAVDGFCRFEELIDAIRQKRIQVQLIVLATPSGLHAAQTIAASRCGVSVCTEKPMATSWKDALMMTDSCKAEKVNLFVVKQNRFNTTLQLLKRQIDKGRFGKIYLCNINVLWHRPQEYYDQAAWRGTKSQDGGALMNQASHYVDLINWLGGPVETVNAEIGTLGRDIEVEDTAVLRVRWKSGGIGTLNTTMLTFPSNLEGSITIIGEKGTVKVGGKAVNRIEEWKFLDSDSDDRLVDQASYEPSSVYGDGHIAYYKNMIGVMRDGEKPICDGEEGLKCLELLMASYKSAELGCTIQLPLPR